MRKPNGMRKSQQLSLRRSDCQCGFLPVGFPEDRRGDGETDCSAFLGKASWGQRVIS